jgi:hypothetical protein
MLLAVDRLAGASVSTTVLSITTYQPRFLQEKSPYRLKEATAERHRTIPSSGVNVIHTGPPPILVRVSVNSSFDKWQADYAAHGVATFPVDANKRGFLQNFPFPATCAGHDWMNTGRSNVISDHDPMTFDQEQGKQLRYYAPAMPGGTKIRVKAEGA